MSDDIFTIHQYTIPFSKFGKTIELTPFGDIHRYADLCHEEKWNEFLEKEKEKIKRGVQKYYIGMGDYDDFLSGNERLIIKKSELHESSVKSIEDYAKKRIYDFDDEIHFMKGKIIGCIEGNHHYEFQSGVSSTQLLCEALNCRYLGVSSFIRLTFKYEKGNKTKSIDLWVHHGKGASRLHGSSLNTVQQMAEAAHADIYLMGHDHKKGLTMMSRLSLGRGGNGNVSLHNNKIILGRTGSFLRGYVPDKRSYVAKRMLQPTDLGSIHIQLTPRCVRSVKSGDFKEDFFIEMNASM